MMLSRAVKNRSIFLFSRCQFHSSVRAAKDYNHKYPGKYGNVISGTAKFFSGLFLGCAAGYYAMPPDDFYPLAASYPVLSKEYRSFSEDSSVTKKFPRMEIAQNQVSLHTGIAASPLEDEKFSRKVTSESNVVKNEADQSGISEPKSIYKNLIKAKYVLVGGGAASYSAMKTIQERDPNADILIVSNELFTPYMRPPLSKEIWFTNSPGDMKFEDWGGTERTVFFDSDSSYEMKDPSEAKDNKPLSRLILGKEATGLDVDAHLLTLEDGTRIKYQKILLATGGKPKLPEFAKGLGDRISNKVSTFRTISDAKKLEKLIKDGKSKRILIIGGGFIGSELSCSLSKFGKQHEIAITQVFPEEGNMSNIFPNYLVKWSMKKISELGVTIKPKSAVTKLLLSGNDSVDVRFDDGSNFEADHVIVAAGCEPNVSLARNAGLEIDENLGGIMVNSELEARTHVYAAGDVASYYDATLGRRRVEHHDHAILSGRTAGRNMVGGNTPLKQQSMYWSDLGPEIGYEAVGILDHNLPTVGIWSNVNGKTEKELSKGRDFEKGVVLYLRDGSIVGVLLWNIYNRTHIARRLISEARKVEDVEKLASVFRIHQD